MPRTTFTDMQARLQTLSQDTVTDVVELKEWASMDMTEVLKRIKYINQEIEAMQKIAFEFQTEIHRVLGD